MSSSSLGGRRRLSPEANTALELIREAGRRRMPVFDFDLRMAQQGIYSTQLERAKGALFRRNWAHVEGSTLVITDEGWSAATTGLGVKVQTKRGPSQKRKHNKLPRGLF